jgi:hypothetical protein
MNNTLNLGPPKGTVSKLILWLLLLLLATSTLCYRGYLNGSLSQIASPIVAFFIFASLFYLLWKNERNNSFIKADEETISIREGIGVDRFSLGDIDQFHVKPESLLKHLSFTAQGIKRWYPLAGLSNGEVSELVEFARRHNRQQRANQ